MFFFMKKYKMKIDNQINLINNSNIFLMTSSSENFLLTDESSSKSNINEIRVSNIS